MTKAAMREMFATLLDHPDTLTFKRDGTVEARWGHFYRMGRSTTKYLAKVKSEFPDADVLGLGVHWAVWPATSYFWVRFRPNLDAATPDRFD